MVSNFKKEMVQTISFLKLGFFGGTFLIHYIRTNDLLIDQLIGFCVGIILLIASLIWRSVHKKR
jgi:hypothetical protein